MTASKGIRKTNAVTGKQVNTAKTSVFDLLNAIRTFDGPCTRKVKGKIAVEQTVAMAA